MEQNNGSIDIKSEFGKGTGVVLRIPAVKKNEEE
jgi:chemotaxis protein histidine kinase CheA